MKFCLLSNVRKHAYELVNGPLKSITCTSKNSLTFYILSEELGTSLKLSEIEASICAVNQPFPMFLAM